MKRSVRIIIVEDSDDDALLIANELKKSDYEPFFERVETAKEFKRALNEGDWDLVISDYSLPQFTGLEAIRMLKEMDREIPFILVSGTIGEEVAVECMRSGANDYFVKNNLQRLNLAVARELEEARIRKERKTVGIRLELFRSIIEQSKDAIFIASVHDGALLDFNQAACDKFGYSRHEFLGLKLEDIEPDISGRPWKEYLESIMYDERIFKEGRFSTKDEDEFVAEVSIQTVAHSEEKYLVEIVRDITEHKKIQEDERKHLEELEVFYRASMNREDRILELKEKVEELESELEKYRKNI